MDSDNPEEDYYAKLELVKEIRQKTISAEKMKLNMKDLLDELHSEEKTLQEYQSEIESLVQEKMAHVEELRLIHTDINTMEDLAKQGKTTRQRLLDELKKAQEEFIPIQKGVNEMRAAIGVPPLEKLENMPSVLISEQPLTTEIKSSVSREVPQMQPLALKAEPEGLGLSMLTLPKSIRQQQAAPMKECQACGNLIHRNAPICPLCKAKSRSRNPKKARRKNET